MTGEAYTAGQEGEGEEEAEEGDDSSSGWAAFNSPVEDENMDQPQTDDDRVYERVTGRIPMDL